MKEGTYEERSSWPQALMVRMLVDPSREMTFIDRMADWKPGKFHYQNAFGQATPNTIMTLESTFRLASCSKLITSIAALQCVERGQVSLDEDVVLILHELKDIPILKGFAKPSGEPILVKSSKTITLR